MPEPTNIQIPDNGLVEDPDDGFVELDDEDGGGDPQPFLRITATYPSAEGRVQTVDVSLNLRDDDAVLEVDDDEPDSTGAITSWLNSFAVDVIAAMRERRIPAVVLSGQALTTILADQVKHAEDCNGDCGVPMPTAATSTNGGGN